MIHDTPPTGPAASSTVPPDMVARLTAVRAAVADACVAHGRAPDAAQVIAVSKTHPASAIRQVLEAGQQDFGENRVQEAQAKWPALKQDYPETTLHLIGPLQSNKVKVAVALFDVIHTIDREKIARALAREMAAQQRRLPCFIQINTGAEPQKAGILPQDAAAFTTRVRNDFGLDVRGLMCIPPVDEAASLHFALLAKLAGELDLPALSMGMSGDFASAAALGARYVRVGTAIFGPRPTVTAS